MPKKLIHQLFLIQNKSKLKYIGKLPSPYDEIYMNFNSDGTVSAVENKNKELEDELNKFILLLKTEIVPLVDYIKSPYSKTNTFYRKSWWCIKIKTFLLCAIYQVTLLY